MRQGASLEHVAALSDDVGIHQHAIYDVPNRHEGYCTDDVARAFILANVASAHEETRELALRLGRVYLAFLMHAQNPDGGFRNFMSYGRAWLDETGTPDSNGRAIWAIGHGLRFSSSQSWRRICAGMLERALPHVDRLAFVRSQAYAGLGLVHAYESFGRDRPTLASRLRALGAEFTARHAACAGAGWDWFEDALTYDNARLAEVVLRIGSVLDDSDLIDLGLRTFAFYESVVVEAGVFVPIGNDGWYERGKARARYAQQPLEAAAFVDAALAAEAVTGEGRYRRLAELGLAWYHGRNSRDALMTAGGACCDGLDALAVNRNMGAESTLAYVASVFALAAPAVSGAAPLAR
jgi:hypothetical protein